MQPHAPSAPAIDEALAKLSASAKGWHTIQLAVLGFIGICGVLQSTTSAPRGVQIFGAGLAIAALAVAVIAVFMVGQVAWPLFDPTNLSPQERLMRVGAALNTGVRLTVVALVLIVVATLMGWWPSA
jgi:hypothetical protein